MTRFSIVAGLAVCALAAGCQQEQQSAGLTALASSGSPADPTPAQLRAEPAVRFNFHYTFSLKDVPTDAGSVRVWVPLPRNDALQQAELVSIDSPVEGRRTVEPVHGNAMMVFDVTPSEGATATWKLSWRITRRELRGSEADRSADPPVGSYLKAERLVPSDGVVAELANQAAGSPGATSIAELTRRMYDFTLSHMNYSKQGVGWGRGDAVWACDSKYGNCTDFHSVFIGMCRAKGIAAKFEIGFPINYSGLEGEIGGYHCWAKYHDGEAGWRAVDISEADKYAALADYFYGTLHARRVHFTTGRDLTLSPPQAGPPLNYFVYPYVEIDGKPHDAVDRKFRFDSLTVVR